MILDFNLFPNTSVVRKKKNLCFLVVRCQEGKKNTHPIHYSGQIRNLSWEVSKKSTAKNKAVIYCQQQFALAGDGQYDLTVPFISNFFDSIFPEPYIVLLTQFCYRLSQNLPVFQLLSRVFRHFGKTQKHFVLWANSFYDPCVLNQLSASPCKV